jgi:hypothetical protein
VIQRAAFNQKVDQISFFGRFFQGVSVWADEKELHPEHGSA